MGEYHYKFQDDPNLYTLVFNADAHTFDIQEEFAFTMETVREIEAIKQNISKYLLEYKMSELEELALM